MSFVNTIVNRISDFLLWPFVQGDSPWMALTGAALIASLLLIGAFKVCSNQEAIRLKKKRITGRLLELLLFQHDLILGCRICVRILLANLSYLREYIRPLALTLIPVILLMVQLACWFDARPLHVGESVVLEVSLSNGFPILEQTVELSTSDSVAVETDSLRIPSQKQLNWRLRAIEPGSGWIQIGARGEVLRKNIVVGKEVTKLSGLRTQPDLWNQLIHPVEDPITSNSPVESIRIRYPAREFVLGTTVMGWLIPFLIMIVVFSLLLGRISRVAF